MNSVYAKDESGWSEWIFQDVDDLTRPRFGENSLEDHPDNVLHAGNMEV